jgi:hypothetical protein
MTTGQFVLALLAGAGLGTTVTSVVTHFLSGRLERKKWLRGARLSAFCKVARLVLTLGAGNERLPSLVRMRGELAETALLLPKERVGVSKRIEAWTVAVAQLHNLAREKKPTEDWQSEFNLVANEGRDLVDVLRAILAKT